MGWHCWLFPAPRIQKPSSYATVNLCNDLRTLRNCMKKIWHNHETIVPWHFCTETHFCDGIRVISIFVFLLAASVCFDHFRQFAMWVGGGILMWLYVILLLKGAVMRAFTPTLVLFPSHPGCSRHPWLRENLCPWSACESHSCISYHYRVPFMVHVSLFFVWFPEVSFRHQTKGLARVLITRELAVVGINWMQ